MQYVIQRARACRAEKRKRLRHSKRCKPKLGHGCDSGRRERNEQCILAGGHWACHIDFNPAVSQPGRQGPKQQLKMAWRRAQWTGPLACGHETDRGGVNQR